MDQVSFINMADGTKEDYEFLEELEKEFNKTLPDRLIESLEKLENTLSGYRVSRLEHSLQSATHAYRNGEDEEMVMAALLHDIGDDLAPYSHSEMAAAVLRPFVSDKTYWIIKHHGIFQMYYYAHHLGGDRNTREMFKDHPYYQPSIDFCELYDQNCFDPDYDSEPLEFFKPMIQKFFTQEPQFQH